MTRPAPALLAGLCLLASAPARAAGPAEGTAAASAEAEFRMEGAELVEIEGFTDAAGDIPCSRKSFSNSWHYKFHSSGAWLKVNACAGTVINAAKHLPYRSGQEPRTKLQYSYASPAEVLRKLDSDGVFRPVPNPLDRDVLMRISHLPAKDGRPAGCYWYVSQGRAKAVTDCMAEKTWKLGGKAPSARGSSGGAGFTGKGHDTANRYVQAAIKTMRHKFPDTRLMFLEALVDRTGNAKCVSAEDGWSYVFSSPGMASVSSFAGCRGGTATEFVSFDGRNTTGLDTLDPITLPFKDSNFALSRVPKDCRAYSTISMKLQKFKPGHSPFSGHSLIWTIDCGSLRYYVDANNGGYLGPGKK